MKLPIQAFWDSDYDISNLDSYTSLGHRMTSSLTEFSNCFNEPFLLQQSMVPAYAQLSASTLLDPMPNSVFEMHILIAGLLWNSMLDDIAFLEIGGFGHLNPPNCSFNYICWNYLGRFWGPSSCPFNAAGIELADNSPVLSRMPCGKEFGIGMISGSTCSGSIKNRYSRSSSPVRGSIPVSTAHDDLLDSSYGLGNGNILKKGIILTILWIEALAIL